MERIKSANQKNIQRYMLRTYLSIAYISVFIEIILCVCMIISANRSVERERTEALSKVMYQMDDIWKNLEERTERLCQDSLLEEALRFKAEPQYHGEDVLKIQSMMELFQSEESYYPEIGQLFFVDPAQKTIVDETRILHGEDAEKLLSSLELSEEVFSGIGFDDKAAFYYPDTGDASSDVLYIKGIFSRSYQVPDGFLVAKADSSVISSRLNLLGSAEGDRIFLAVCQNRLIGNDPLRQELFEKIGSEGPDHARIRSEGKSYLAFRTDSTHPDMAYYHVVAVSSHYREVYIVILFTVITLVVLMGLSILFARKFTRENITPLRKIMETIREGEDDEESFTYDHMIEMAGRLLGRVNGYEDQNRKEILPRIFNGQIRKTEEIEDYQRQHEEELRNGFYVLSIRLVSKEEPEESDIKVFCAMNIFEETLREHIVLTPVENWDRVYFLIRDRQEAVEEKVRYCRKYMEERLSIKVECGFSERMQSFLRISDARTQADYMAEYGMLRRQEDRTMWYEDLIRLDQIPSNLYGDTVKRIINLTMAQDYGTALEILHRLWETELSSPLIDGEDAKSKLLTILTIISIPHREKFGQRPPVPKEEWNNLSYIYEDICRMMKELQENKDQQGDPGKATSEKMRSYIREHATDPEITAKSVAEAFGLTGSYASSMFKKYTGEGILEYIHKERIREAKQLLKEGCSVQEAAEKTGYLEARSLIRAFKKYEGITPGQYKTL